MFITKKNFEKALAEREKQIAERFERADYEQNKNRHLHERIDRLEENICEMNMQINELRGIKKKYDEVCKVVNGIGI